jgi:predicted deacetylase
MRNIPRPAQYLLRIDDVCPTVHAERWQRLRMLIEEFSIRPILAVVPDNRDRDLDASHRDPAFWNSMRALQAAGAAIALHGLHHVCCASGRSLIPLHSTSEFAGFDLDAQSHRIARGLQTLRSHSLEPRLFVAPRHGFDRNTLLALRQHGIGFISDGLARLPFVRFGVTWIPMQLWSPLTRDAGLWTVCIHPNSADDAQIESLRRFLIQRASQFTSFDRVIAEFTPQPLGAVERAYEFIAMARLRLRRARSGWRRPQAPRFPSTHSPIASDAD